MGIDSFIEKHLSKSFWILIVAFVVVSTGCTTLNSIWGWRVKQNVVFKEVDGKVLRGDIYVPEGAKSSPIVVVVHGGGWKNRSGDMESLCRILVKRGFVVFNMTYRLAPESLYPKAIEDVRDGIKWIKSHATEYGGDPERVAGWGYSAGAHLILMVGLDASVGVKAIVAGGTPADLTAWPKSPLVKTFLGMERDQNLSLWKEASPINKIQSDSPPVFLYHGEWDFLVEVDQMTKMESALKAKGVPVETYAVPFLGHVGVYLLSRKSVDRGMEFISKKLN